MHSSYCNTALIIIKSKAKEGKRSDNLLGDGLVAWPERGHHGGGGDVADLGQGGGEEEQHEEKLESVGGGRAEARERGEPVVPGGEELVAWQPGGDTPRRRNEAPEKAAHGHGCFPLLPSLPSPPLVWRSRL